MNVNVNVNVKRGARDIVCALHGVSPRDRWLCVLPRGQMNVNVTPVVASVVLTFTQLARRVCMLSIAAGDGRRARSPLPVSFASRHRRGPATGSAATHVAKAVRFAAYALGASDRS